MGKRSLTSIVYVIILLTFYGLRLYLRNFFFHALIFDVLILLFSVFGTFEMCRALGDKLDNVQKTIIQIFSAGTIVCYAVSDVVYKKLQETQDVVNYSPNLAFAVFMAGLAILVALLVFRFQKTSLESAGASLLAYLYPSVFLLVLSGVNHMPRYSELGILYVFAICPIADCFAFLFGKCLKKKFPGKMAPNVSPNKTVVGGIGGLIGGAFGAVCIFFAYYGLIVPLVTKGSISISNIDLKWTNLIFYIGLGVLCACFAELGDLVESAIKRKLEIKDMGKILPGHGGILDRIDSALYCSLIVCFVVVIRILTTG